MTDERKVAFRTALNGYRKEDVNQYILTANRESEEREASLRAEAEGAKAELQALRSEASAGVQELESLRTAAEEAQTSLKQAESLLAALRESDAQKAEQIESLREQQAAMQAENAGLREQLAQAAQTESELEKSQKYDQISTQVGDIMINANSSAERIISAANTEANRIVAETEDEALYIRTRLSDAADEMLTKISGELHASTDHCISELMDALREMRDSTAAMITEFEKRSSELNERVDYYHTSVNDTVKASLASMDEKYGIRRAESNPRTDR